MSAPGDRGASRTVGGGLHPRNVLRVLHGLLKGAKLPRVRFHDLRHSAASLLIAEGVELVEVSMLLGHSELRVTADLSARLVNQTAAKAAEKMDALLRGHETYASCAARRGASHLRDGVIGCREAIKP